MVHKINISYNKKYNSDTAQYIQQDDDAKKKMCQFSDLANV
jgi:hypothetical protein